MILDILNKCNIEGNSVRLPAVQLERNEYTELEKMLLKAGAKKMRGKDFRFDFPTDAQPIIDKLLGGDKIDIKKEFQFFATPKELAEKMLKLADLKSTDFICEPSAGQGAIVDLIPKEFDNVFLYELNDLNRSVLESKGYILTGDDFLKAKYDNTNIPVTNQFDKIIANPPFSKNQDCTHVQQMYNCLNEGGRIVTIMSNHWRESKNKKEMEFKAWLDNLDYSIDEIPRDTFKESGTSVSACLVIIDK